MFRISLFGTGQAHYFDRPMREFPNKQSCLLLCYLILNRGYPHHREHLATLFWRDQPTQTARKRLRNTLWSLRKSLQSIGAPIQDYLRITDESIAFLTMKSYWLDADRFEAKTEACQDLSGKELTSAQVSQLEDAMDLYVGDLLEGVFEDWILYDRERLRLTYLNALSKLMVFHGYQRNYERGLAYGKRVLALDNTREKIHRQMMWLYSLSGDRNAALAQYQRCRDILHAELKLPPMAETRRLYEQIKSERYPSRIELGEQSNLEMQERFPSHNKIHAIVKHALEKIQNLQETNEQTTAELLIIEQLIQQAFANSDTN